MTPSSHYDAVIIGAGFSGLAAGIRLAYFDKKVLILERHYVAGGLNSFYSRGGRKYDVGLHALTNYTQEHGPLRQVLRQLRIKWEDLSLVPQKQSRICFPSVHLTFTNDFKDFEAQIAQHFPHAIDGFRRMVAVLPSFEEALVHPNRSGSAQVFLKDYIQDPLLLDVLSCPIFYYGSAKENDIDFAQWVILFRSIFLSGFGRPAGGIRVLLKALLDRYRTLGGERKMGCSVEKINIQPGLPIQLSLSTGEAITTGRVFSSAGISQTQALCGLGCAKEYQPLFSFFETQLTYLREHTDHRWEDTIIFYNQNDTFDYRCPATAIDGQSGVICLPHNYQYESPSAWTEGWLKITTLANPKIWQAYSQEDYIIAKQQAQEALYAAARSVLPALTTDMPILAVDSFTAKTIHRYTGHLDGAVYGSPLKAYDGHIGLEGIHLIGTDQGLLGIVGAMLSGIHAANRHAGSTME